MRSKIALFGGSFNPAHVGHYKIALNIISLNWVEKLIIIPTSSNPLKQNRLKFDKQVDIILATFGRISNSILDWHSFYKTPPHYTIDDLQRLKNVYGADQEFAFFMGSDAWKSFSFWKDYKKIIQLSSIFVIKRNDQNFSNDVDNSHGIKGVYFLDWDIPQVSSKQIFDNVKNISFLKQSLTNTAYKILKK